MRECRVEGCHLELVVCEECEEKGGVRCCEDCEDVHRGEGGASRRMCQCERERERSLWGEGGAALSQKKGKPKTKAKSMTAR